MNNIVQFSSTGFPAEHCSCGCGGGPGCTCGGQGGWDGAQWGDPLWGKGLRQCWQEIAQLKAIIRQIMQESGPFPIQGVTDGSNAAAGMVGEHIQGSAVVNFEAYPAVTNTVVSVLVVPPGDWDLRIASQFSVFIGGTFIYLDPVPAGMSSALEGGMQLFSTVQQASNTELTTVVIGEYARGSFTVPTLLPVRVKIDQSTDQILTAGTCTISIQGRRAR